MKEVINGEFLMKHAFIGSILFGLKHVLSGGGGFSFGVFIGELAGTIIGTMLVAFVIGWLISVVVKTSLAKAFSWSFFIIMALNMLTHFM